MGFVLTQAIVMAALYAVAMATLPLARVIAGDPARDQSRDPHLDGLRGVAAVGVVACHVNQYMVSFLGYQEPPIIGNHLGIIGVQMFFSLTAYLFTDRAMNGKLFPAAFFVGRIRRILPLYFLVCATALVIAWWFSRGITISSYQMAHEAARVVSFGFWKTDEISFRGVNMLSLVGIAWTLSYEWAFYLLLVPGYFLWRLGVIARTAILCLAVFVAARDFHGQGEQVIWPFFLPGVLAAWLKGRVGHSAGRVLLLLSVPSLVLVFWLPGFWTAPKLLLATIIFGAVLFASPRWLAWRPLRTLGMISYSIYLVQYLVLYPAVQTIFTTPALSSTAARMGMGGFIVASTVVLAACTYRLVELRWMTKREPRMPARAMPDVAT